jgi:prepilin-type N-terminal cleavage/methylation domain-containing protein
MRLRGFTLLETLVVIGIIAVIAAILFPVLSSSKKQARKVDDISKMRQLGLAGAMYQEKYGVLPLSTVQLVAEGAIPRELCQSHLDETEEGIANVTSDLENKAMGAFTHLTRADYKNTFIGMGEFGLSTDMYDKYIESGPGAGWLVDVTMSSKNIFPNPAQWDGKYMRLLADGAVVPKVHKDFDCYDGGKVRKCRMSILLYVDPSDRFSELQKLDDSESSAVSH